MESITNKTAVVVLAAGKGKRMAKANGDLPKVLTPLAGRPMISYLLESIKQAGVAEQIVLVVGRGADEVQRTIGAGYEYVIQTEQLGTGHAVGCAESLLTGPDKRIAHVMVLYGDNPLVSAQTIQKLHTLHLHEGRVLTMLTTSVTDFNDWRAPLYDFGRIVRDGNGNIVGIREKKDASAEELSIRELNPGLMIFKDEWLWNNLKQLSNINAQQEFYLVDLVTIAIRSGEKIAVGSVAPVESLGINTPEHLELANYLLQRK